MGNIIDRKRRSQDILPGALFMGVTRPLMALTHVPPGSAEDDQHHQKNSKLFSIHFAAVRLRFKNARPMPESATTAGIPMMLPHLMVFSSELMSRVSFLRSCFNWTLTSASFFLSFSSSTCCSGERIKRWVP